MINKTERTIWIYDGAMLQHPLSSFVHRIYIHPTLPRLVPSNPKEIVALATYFQSISAAVLEIYYRGNKPSHELKIRSLIESRSIPKISWSVLLRMDQFVPWFLNDRGSLIWLILNIILHFFFFFDNFNMWQKMEYFFSNFRKSYNFRLFRLPGFAISVCC